MDRLKLALGIGFVLACGFTVKQCQNAAREWGAWESDTTRLFTQLEVDRLLSDSLKAVAARQDAEVAKLTERANRLQVSLSASRSVGDSLFGVLSASPDSAISRPEAITALESYRVALGEAQERSTVLEAIIAAQKSQIVQLSQSEALGWKNADSLAALIRRTPSPCRLPVLGIRCPTVGVGYGLTTDGPRVVLAVVVPIR